MNGLDALKMRCPLFSRKQTCIGRCPKVGFSDWQPEILRMNQRSESSGRAAAGGGTAMRSKRGAAQAGRTPQPRKANEIRRPHLFPMPRSPNTVITSAFREQRVE